MPWWIFVGGIGFLFAGWGGFFTAIIGVAVASFILGLFFIE